MICCSYFLLSFISPPIPNLHEFSGLQASTDVLLSRVISITSSFRTPQYHGGQSFFPSPTKSRTVSTINFTAQKNNPITYYGRLIVELFNDAVPNKMEKLQCAVSRYLGRILMVAYLKVLSFSLTDNN